MNDSSKSYIIEVEDYQSGVLEIEFPEGKGPADIACIWYNYRDVIIDFKNGTRHNAGPIPCLDSEDGYRFRLSDEDYDECFYDSWS